MQPWWLNGSGEFLIQLRNLWYKLMRAKYLNVDNIFVRNSQSGSQFWRSINKIKHLFKLGAKYHLGSGERIFFWTDWWQGEGPLAIKYLRLFDICSSKTISVAQALPISPTSLQFKCSFWKKYALEAIIILLLSYSLFMIMLIFHARIVLSGNINTCVVYEQHHVTRERTLGPHL
jgi:hypothetical protein